MPILNCQLIKDGPLSLPHEIDEKFLQDLISSHRQVLEAMHEISPHAMPYYEVKKKLIVLYEEIFQYLSLQKSDRFERLREALVGEPDKLKIVNFLENDLKELRITMYWFSDEHRADMGDMNPKNFIRDFQELSQSLVGRIKREEELLLPLLSGLQKKE